MIEVAEVSPSAELWRTLLSLDPAELQVDELTAAVVACERVKSCVEAVQNELLVAWDRIGRPAVGEVDPRWAVRQRHERWRIEGLALEWGVSAFTAGNRVAQAVVLVETLPHLHAALRAGRVTAHHARMTANAARHLPAAVALEADKAVMAADGWRTPSQLERAFRTHVLRLDPEGSAERQRAARKDRQVSVRDQPDGMASAFALLPAEDAQSLIKTLDACALSSKATNAPGDDRTLAQRRADALVELVTGSSSWSATFRPTGQDPTGPAATASAPDGSDGSDGFDGSEGPAARCSCGGAQNTASTVNRDATTHGRRVDVQVTVAWSTLIGCDDAPAVLTGYGPIDASTARRICADPAAVWRRLLVDPASGTLLDYGRRTYRPPADLRDFVIARDVNCRFPNCDRPAMVCELDHREEFDHAGDGTTGGTTSPGNVDALCKSHHRLKHEAGWTHHRDPDTGDSVWTDPQGREYTKNATTLPTPVRVEAPTTEVEPAVQDDLDLGDPPF